MEGKESKKIDGDVGESGVETSKEQFGIPADAEVEFDLGAIGKIKILKSSMKQIEEIKRMTKYGDKEAISLLIDWGVLSYMKYVKEVNVKIAAEKAKNKDKHGTKIITGKPSKNITTGRKIIY